MISQCDAILAHLKAGNTLTPAEAYALFGTMVLHSRAAELRDRGEPITCRIVTEGRRRWGVYSYGSTADTRESEGFAVIRGAKWLTTSTT